MEVPVTVLGRDGQPVRGLSASDFELFDDGARQRIEAMDVVDLVRIREADGKPWTASPWRPGAGSCSCST